MGECGDNNMVETNAMSNLSQAASGLDVYVIVYDSSESVRASGARADVPSLSSIDLTLC